MSADLNVGKRLAQVKSYELGRGYTAGHANYAAADTFSTRMQRYSSKTFITVCFWCRLQQHWRPPVLHLRPTDIVIFLQQNQPLRNRTGKRQNDGHLLAIIENIIIVQKQYLYLYKNGNILLCFFSGLPLLESSICQANGISRTHLFCFINWTLIV